MLRGQGAHDFTWVENHSRALGKNQVLSGQSVAVGAWVLDGTEELVGKPGLEAL
jgi:hypothetical protein